MEQRELPLFMLNTVLFPNMVLPIHVFEERYKKLVKDCMAGDETFGVLLIREGAEVGSPAIPYQVGTTAKISELNKQEEDINLVTFGERRFRLVEIVDYRPYAVGIVELLSEEVEPPEMPSLMEEMDEVVQVSLRRLMALNGEWVRNPRFTRDPVELSYLIASRIPAEMDVKQRLLESPTCWSRLRAEIPLIKAEAERLQLLLYQRMWVRSPQLN